jgi:hypothetical protein
MWPNEKYLGRIVTLRRSSFLAEKGTGEVVKVWPHDDRDFLMSVRRPDGREFTCTRSEVTMHRPNTPSPP